MEVSKQINDLIEKYRCTAKELANASDLSVSVISRYRNGTRRPSKQQLQKLAKGFEIIARQHGEEFDLSDMDISTENDNMDIFVRKFNILVSALDINMNDFAKINAIYAEFFEEGSYPARSCVEVARLPKDVLMEMEAIALA